MRLSLLVECLKSEIKSKGDIDVYPEILRVLDADGKDKKIKLVPHLSRKEKKIMFYVLLIGAGYFAGTIVALLTLRAWGMLWL